MKDCLTLADVCPRDYLTFTRGLDLSSTLSITNLSPGPLFFRVKTNSPAAYNITPYTGSLSQGEQASIKVTLMVMMSEGEATSRHRIQVLVQTSSGSETSIALLSVRIDQRQESLSPRRFHTAHSGDDYDILKQLTEENQRLVRDVAKLRLETERLEASARPTHKRMAWQPVLCFFLGVIGAKLVSSGHLLGYEVF